MQPCIHVHILYTGLDRKVDDVDLTLVSKNYLINWESLRPYLGLNILQEKYIHELFPRDYVKQKLVCLEMWRETKGSEATYGALIKAAKEAGSQSLVRSVQHMLKKQKIMPAPQSKSVYKFEFWF